MGKLKPLWRLLNSLSCHPGAKSLSPEDRAGLARRNAWLLSWQGWPAWLAAVLLAWATTGAFVAFGWPLEPALAGGLPTGLLIVWGWTTSWFVPRVQPGKHWRFKLWWALAGAAVMLYWAYDHFHTVQGWQWTLAPLILFGVFMLSFSEFLFFRAGMLSAQRERDQLRLTQEREMAAHRATEARLKLLQAQIQPHFLFNTLASLQHWVDSGDARAAPLLRSLTAFLRGATELMHRDAAPLADEWPLAEHYLAIMRARVGERMRYSLQMSEAAGRQALPPGLLLTLVENAVEHGVGESLHDVAVHIEAETDATGWRLRVIDTGRGLAPGWREGVGLANVRERLQHHFGERAQLRLRSAEPGTVAEVTIAQVPTAA